MELLQGWGALSPSESWDASVSVCLSLSCLAQSLHLHTTHLSVPFGPPYSPCPGLQNLLSPHWEALCFRASRQGRSEAKRPGDRWCGRGPPRPPPPGFPVAARGATARLLPCLRGSPQPGGLPWALGLPTLGARGSRGGKGDHPQFRDTASGSLDLLPAGHQVWAAGHAQARRAQARWVPLNANQVPLGFGVSVSWHAQFTTHCPEEKGKRDTLTHLCLHFKLLRLPPFLLPISG